MTSACASSRSTSARILPQSSAWWLAAAARWNPLTLAVDAWRGALLFGEMPSVTGQVLPLAALAAVLYLAAAREMRGIGALY